jgi:DNA replication protein DnaC
VSRNKYGVPGIPIRNSGILKLSKAKNLYSLIDYYAKAQVLCIDELGYVIPTKEQADCLFQIISRNKFQGHHT